MLSELQVVLDSPLGPVPPVLGLLLLFLALLLALRRRWTAARQRRELEEAKSAFMRVASHELRTPLTVIRGYMSMAQEGTLSGSPTEMAEVMATLNANVEDLYRLTELMLEAAQIEVHALKLHKRHLDLRDVVRDSVRLFEEKLAAKETRPSSRHRLVLEVDGAPVPVRGDPERLATVVGNLLDNAVLRSPQGSEVRCRVHAWGRQARIEVQHPGPALSPQEQSALFERFGKSSETTGSGLGLYLARELTRLHHGDVKVQSVEGEGTTFVVSLRLSRSIWNRLRGTRVAQASERSQPAG